jgi:alkylhydroperoxidase/carboxymuconolactone decarboxylase family protein YurZ
VPINCNTLPTEEERAQCILIQNRTVSLAAIDMSVPAGCKPDVATHLRAAATDVENAIRALNIAGRHNAGLGEA